MNIRLTGKTFELALELVLGHLYEINAHTQTTFTVDCGRGVFKDVRFDISPTGYIHIIVDGEGKALVRQSDPASLVEEYPLFDLLTKISQSLGLSTC